MNDELSQADADAQLIVEAFALGKWDVYQRLWSEDVERRIQERFSRHEQPGDENTEGQDSG